MARGFDSFYKKRKSLDNERIEKQERNEGLYKNNDLDDEIYEIINDLRKSDPDNNELCDLMIQTLEKLKKSDQKEDIGKTKEDSNDFKKGLGKMTETDPEEKRKQRESDERDKKSPGISHEKEI